jgi:hypothetical protein
LESFFLAEEKRTIRTLFFQDHWPDQDLCHKSGTHGIGAEAPRACARRGECGALARRVIGNVGRWRGASWGMWGAGAARHRECRALARHDIPDIS